MWRHASFKHGLKPVCHLTVVTWAQYRCTSHQEEIQVSCVYACITLNESKSIISSECRSTFNVAAQKDEKIKNVNPSPMSLYRVNETLF